MRTAVLKYKEVSQASIFKPNFHLNEGKRNLTELINRGVECTTIGEIVKDIYTGGIFKRVFVSNGETGIPYISAQDMMNQNPKKSAKLISKKYTPRQDDMTLKENTILVSCAGTVGNIRLIDSSFKDIIGSQDIIRVIPNISDYGFIYAYLSSKTCHSYIQSLIYGSVVPRIEPKAVSNIIVPIFPQSKQQEIHNLIVESAKLRVEANLLLEEAISELEKELPTMIEHKYEKVSLSLMIENGLRMEATTNHIQIKHFYEKLNEKYEIRTIADMSKEVFTPNIFKRQRTSDVSTGIPFLSGSDLTNFRPSFTSFLSKKMKNIDNYILRDGWIAVQDAGTIGYVTLINGYLDGVSATNNLVRIIPNKENDNLYIFAFLKTKQGQFILKSQQFGSVQKHIDNNAIANFKIPILNSCERVKSKVLQYNLKTTESCIKESQAISLVEKEIESWQ